MSDTRTASVAAADLAKALKFARQPIEKRNIVPILSAVLLAFKAGRLTITGTDLDVWCEYGVEAEVAEPFEFGVTPKYLAGIVSAAAGARIEFTVDLAEVDSICRVRAGDFSGSFRSIFPAEDFPTFVAGPDYSAASISERDLRLILGDTIPCISREETRYYLNGVYMHQGEGKALWAVATDGHRLALRKTDAGWPAELNGIMPAKVAHILHRAMRGDGNATIRLTGNSSRQVATPDSDDWKVKFKMIDGTYPDYTRVITKGDCQVLVPVSLGSINRALAFSSRGCGWGGGEGKILKFDLDTSEVSTKLDDRSEIRLPLLGISGSGQFGVNGFYLRDFLRRHSPARLRSVAANDPIFVDTEDPRLTQIVMPARV